MVVDDFWGHVDRSAGDEKCWPWTRCVQKRSPNRTRPSIRDVLTRKTWAHVAEEAI